MRFQVTATGVIELASVSHESNAGNYFGERVRVVNTVPSDEATAQTLFLAVGMPGKDRGDAVDAGMVKVFSAAANAAGSPTIVERSDASLPGPAADGEMLGVALGASAQHLYLASPYRDRAVYAVPWTALAAGTAGPTSVWRAGDGGFPADAVAFGTAIG